MPQKIIYTAIASGSSVGSDVDLSFGTKLWAISVPPVTSADLMIQGNFIDSSSANFQRMLDSRIPGSADLRLAVGGGNRLVMWPPDFNTPTRIRLEMGAPQNSLTSNVATFAILVR